MHFFLVPARYVAQVLAVDSVLKQRSAILETSLNRGSPRLITGLTCSITHKLLLLSNLDMAGVSAVAVVPVVSGSLASTR